MIRSIISKLIRNIHERGYNPYIRNFRFDNLELRFFIATKQAESWYDPISLWTQIEFQWIQRNLDLNDQIILDAGSHHGLYSTFFGVAGSGKNRVISIDPIEMNIDLTEVNMLLNGLEPCLQRCAVGPDPGHTYFDNLSNSMMSGGSGIRVAVKPLPDIQPDATLVKLDIEGSEFSLFPEQLDGMPWVNTWIIEVHTRHGDPGPLMDYFREREFQLYWLNKSARKIEQAQPSLQISEHHTTIIARKT